MLYENKPGLHFQPESVTMNFALRKLQIYKQLRKIKFPWLTMYPDRTLHKTSLLAKPRKFLLWNFGVYSSISWGWEYVFIIDINQSALSEVSIAMIIYVLMSKLRFFIMPLLQLYLQALENTFWKLLWLKLDKSCLHSLLWIVCHLHRRKCSAAHK